MKLADQLIETISKDINEVENSKTTNPRGTRKDCNLIKQRIESLKKLIENDENAQEIKQTLLIFEKKLEILAK